MEDDDLKDEALAIAKFQSQQKAKQRNYEKVVEALQSAEEERSKALEKAKNAEEEKIKALEEKREKIKVQVVKFCQKKYLNEDISWLENLTEKQYDEILELLFEDKSLDEIKQVIGK